MRPKHQRQRIENKFKDERFKIHSKEFDKNTEQINYLQRIIKKYDMLSVSKNDTIILNQLKNKLSHYENRTRFLETKMKHF